jgi:hypothetical protein
VARDEPPLGSWEPDKTDPTKLTQEAVDRSLEAYRRENDVRTQSLVQQMEALFRAALAETRRVDEVHGQRFAGIQTQFEERDDRAQQLAADTERQATKLAADSDLKLNAALAAQKEAAAEANKSSALAIGKSEAATKEQQNADRILFSSRLDAVTKEVGEVRRQVDKAPGEQAAATKTEKRLDSGQLVAYVIALVAVIGLLVTLWRK